MRRSENTIRRRFFFTGAALLVLLLVSASPHAGDLRPASAGANLPTALIELDGTDSENPDGGDMLYEWTQIEGPKVELSDPRAPKPYFRTGKPGLYRFQLIVTANGLKSDPFIVELMIERENNPPIAKAPEETRGEVGKLLEVDGRESYDPEGNELTYRWRPLTRGLDIPFAALNQPVLSFEPTQDGVFEVELVVSDGETVSRPAITRLTIRPRPRPPVARGRAVPREIPTAPQPEQTMAPPAGSAPVARIEGPTVTQLGEAVMLDARGSRGSSGSRLEYLWRQKSGAFIGDFELVFDGAAERFVPPRVGDYEFELIVADGPRESPPIIHKLQVVKEPDPPVAVVVAPARAMPGALVRMDATQSYDLQGSPLVYRWRQTGGPKVTKYVIDEKIGDAAPAFHPPSDGMYSFELVVSNGKKQSKPVEIDIEVGTARRQPSLAIIGPEVANAGDRLLLAVEPRDADGRALTYAWRQVEGPGTAMVPASGPRIAATPPAPGRYIIDVTALENGQVVATARRTLEVFAASKATPPAESLQNPGGLSMPAPIQTIAAPPMASPLVEPPPPAPSALSSPPAAPATPPRERELRPGSVRPTAQIHPSSVGEKPFLFNESSALEPLSPLP